MINNCCLSKEIGDPACMNVLPMRRMEDALAGCRWSVLGQHEGQKR